jgi:hypothetical protein
MPTFKTDVNFVDNYNIIIGGNILPNDVIKFRNGGGNTFIAVNKYNFVNATGYDFDLATSTVTVNGQTTNLSAIVNPIEYLNSLLISISNNSNMKPSVSYSINLTHTTLNQPLMTNPSVVDQFFTSFLVNSNDIVDRVMRILINIAGNPMNVAYITVPALCGNAVNNPELDLMPLIPEIFKEIDPNGNKILRLKANDYITIIMSDVTSVPLKTISVFATGYTN